MKTHRVWLSLTLAIAFACGGAQHGRTPTIEELRQRAAARPDDFEAQRALAEAELLLRGGDASRAQAQIQRALELEPDDIGLRHIAATEREVHGAMSDALDGYLDVIRRATRSDDPLAPALAQVAAAEVEGLDDAVPGYTERVRDALAPIHASPGNIGDGARSTIGDLLIDIAYRQGDPDRVAEIVAEQRCIDTWRIAGPLGPRHLLGFDRELAPDGDERLADRYDYGPGRGERDTREARGRGCNVHLGRGPVAGAGTTYAESTLEVPSGGRWVVRLETPNAVELFIDGESVARLDRRREAMSRTSYHAVQLDAGAHRVRVKIASRHPNPVINVSVSQTPGTPGGAELEGETLTHDYGRIQLLMARGDFVHASEAVRPHLVEDGSSTLLIVGAAAALNHPLRGSTVRHDTARRLLGWAAARDEDAHYPRLALGQLAANENRDLEAIEAMREGAERWPEVVMFPLQLVDYLGGRGWRAQAMEAAQSAHEAVPTACRPLRAMLGEIRRRHQADEAMAMAQRVVECDARSDAVLSLLVLRREWEPALAEIARLATLDPNPNGLGAAQARLGVARAQGDEEAVQRGILQIAEHMPQATAPILAGADRLLADGNQSGAMEHFRAALRDEPDAMADLRRPLRAIGGGHPLDDYRRDGAEVIRELEASGRVYEGGMLLVFDYTVYRVFEDGSMVELTHNIFRLQDQAAIDRMGEFAVPEHAQLLTIQTVKADGTRLEPDEIEGKDTISFPSLSPGDYIEFEYFRPHPPPSGFPGGFLGDRFYFQNYETPFDLSQLTVITPSGVEVVTDPRGPAPETEVLERDGERIHRWTVRESRPLTQEPASVPSREFFPSIYWGYRATWDEYVESLRDVLADRDVRDPAAVRLLGEILGPEDERATAEQRGERIYRWVVENVEDSNDVFDPAPAMLAARVGNRTRVLHYLFGLAGLESDLAVARAFTADQTDGALPDDDTFQNLIVRLRGSEGHLWIHAGSQHAPFGHVPPRLASMDALLLTESAERVELPPRDMDEDLRSVEVDVELRDDGGARIRVEERFRGQAAINWRAQLENIPDADVESRFESQYVANLLPGGDLTRLRIRGREATASALVLRYEVEMRNLARESGGALIVPPVYRARLGPQYAPVAARQHTQLVPDALALDVEVRLRAPRGRAFDTTPPAADLRVLEGAFTTVEASEEDGVLRIRRRYRIPAMRIEPGSYAEFATFCREVDVAESSEVRLR